METFKSILRNIQTHSLVLFIGFFILFQGITVFGSISKEEAEKLADDIKDSVERLMIKNATLKNDLDINIYNCFKNRRDGYARLIDFNYRKNLSSSKNRPRKYDTTEINLIDRLIIMKNIKELDDLSIDTTGGIYYKAYKVTGHDDCLSCHHHSGKDTHDTKEWGAISVRIPNVETDSN